MFHEGLLNHIIRTLPIPGIRVGIFLALRRRCKCPVVVWRGSVVPVRRQLSRRRVVCRVIGSIGYVIVGVRRVFGWSSMRRRRELVRLGVVSLALRWIAA